MKFIEAIDDEIAQWRKEWRDYLEREMYVSGFHNGELIRAALSEPSEARQMTSTVRAGLTGVVK